MSRFARGTGGRSSVNGNVVTVFGATGMMGRIICNRLGKEGTQLIIPTRGDQWDARSIKLVGDLGQVWILDYDLRDPEKIRRAIQYSNVVINCIGADYETRYITLLCMILMTIISYYHCFLRSNFSYNDVHVEGPRLIAKIARECNVEKFIHFSCLNASPNPQKIYFKPSQFLISKVYFRW